MGNVGERFTGTITGLVLEEVTFDPFTWESTPVPGGEGWCIDTYPFDVDIDPPG